MTWYLVMYSLHLLAVQHATGIIEVVKFPTASACTMARGVGNSDDGVVSVCTSAQKDVSGFMAAMNCSDTTVQKLGDGTEVARFKCAPIFTPK